MEDSPEGRPLSKTVCFVCRHRKIRCDKRLPKCDGCIRSKIDCQYVKTKQKPGLRAGYVSELEQRLAKLERNVQELKAGPCNTGTDNLDSVATENAPHSAIGNMPQVTGSHSSSPALHEGPSNTTSLISNISTLHLDLSFDSLPKTAISELCAIWFTTYHSWIPILHQPSLMEILDTQSTLSNNAHHIIFKAIAAVTLTHSLSLHAHNSEERDRLFCQLRDQIVVEAFNQLKLQSLQALLILCIREWGSGNLSHLWNMIALAKRMGTLLGLRDLVANHCSNYNQSSNLPPRMLPLPSSPVNQEEKIRAYWMTEALDCSSTVGAAWNINVSPPSTTGLLPCSDMVWSFPSAIISLWSFGDFETPSAFSLYVMLVTNELFYVHKFLQQSFYRQSPEEQVRQQNECKIVDRRLMDWKEKFISATVQLRSENDGEFDPNVVLTQCILNLAVISIYQRLVMPPIPEDEVQGPWQHAIDRCMQACESITSTVQGMRDTELENISPLIISCIFVPSRLCLVHSKLLDAEVPGNLDLLVYSLKICGQRWTYARRLEKVLRTAIAEHKLPVEMSSLPVQFYDLQYSYLDIDEALRVWAEGLEPWMQLTGLEHKAQ